MKDRIPFSKVCIGAEEENEVLECLRSGWITTGPRVAQFEKDFAEYVGCHEAVAVSSGTAALHLALWALDLKQGDEVITPSLTWVSVPNLVMILGGRPVFCDVDSQTLNMDLNELERRITSRTKAIVPVHFAGRPVDLDALHELAEAKGIYVIEDACHAIGAECKGKRIGSHSGLCAFSFHPNKNITTAEGGMLTGMDTKRLKRARLQRFHGISRDTYKRTGSGQLPHYETLYPGLKLNMTDISAALGIHQLKKIDFFNKERERIVKSYRAAFKHIEDRIWVPHLCNEPGMVHSWHLFTICVKDKPGLRERIMQHLLELGIQTGLHYLPVHQMPGIAEKFGKKRLPETEKIGRTIISLPLFPGMHRDQIERVVQGIKKSFD